MPKFDDLLKNGTVLGVAIGLGAAAVAAALVPALPAIARAGRPAARGVLKSGLILMAQGREALAEASEEFEDLLAEVSAEMQQQRHAQFADLDGAEAGCKTHQG